MSNIQTNDDQTEVTLSESSESEVTNNQTITGRGAFVIKTVAGGVAVGARLLQEDNSQLEIDGKPMDAIFPNLDYALAQIDQMRRVVIEHFQQAANVGMQVLAQMEASDQKND